MHAGEHASDRIVQHHRHAIGGQDREDDVGRLRDQGVGVTDGVVERERASPLVRLTDDAYPGPMHLARENEIVQARAEAGRQPAPVLEHVRRVVADAQAQVQRRVRPGRHPPGPGGDRRIGAGRVQRRPGQQRQRPRRAEQGGASGDRARRERLGVRGHR